MSKPERTFDEKLKTIAGVFAALGSVVAAVTGLNDQVKKMIDVVVELPTTVWWVIAGLLLILGISGLMHGLARRSRLLRPEALLLKSHKAEHLKGREEDIDRLLMLCRDYSLVHLVGESGAGKSALLQAGLCHKLRQDSAGLLPIYIEVWGQDWEAGPRSALTEAFWQALSEPNRLALNLKTLNHSDDLFATLKHCQPSLRRTPLLIFDQFDDYQTRHRSRFLSNRQRTWFGAEKLIAANAFWREIKTLLDHDAIHCLFVTRSDTAAGLESVRFVEPQVYALERLQEAVVQPLLIELTSSADENAPIIYAPEHGWNKLKQRLTSDLSQQGAVLPAQMKIAFQGLARLKTLTIAEYQRIGGLPGLEAMHIEGHVAEAERHFNHTRQGAQLTQKQIRGLLLSLVNRETLKTVPRSNEELERVIRADYAGEAKPLQQAVQDCLDYLEKREIIRKRIDLDTRRQLWLLDHDYLCAGVLEAERRANRWLALAEAGSRAFQEAGSHIWKKWRSLLTPWQQLVLVIQRLLGRFRYGTLRAYALRSLLRFTPYILILALASYGWYQWLAREQASHILAKIGVSENEMLTASEIDALWTLTTSNEAVRFRFLEQALAIPDNAVRFSRRLDIAAQAIIGLDPARREKALKNVLLPHLQDSTTDVEIGMACVKTGRAIGVPDSTLAPFARQFSTKVMRPNISSDSLKILDPSSGKPAQYFTGDPAKIEIYETKYLPSLQSWDKALAAVPEKLSSEEANRKFTLILEQMKRTTKPNALQSLAEALATVSGKLSSEDANQAFEQILMQMKRTFDPTALQSLAEALVAVSGKLSSEDAKQAFTLILEQMKEATNLNTFQSLAKALATVSGKLSSEDANQAFEQIVSLMKRTTNPSVLQSLAEVLATVPEKLTLEHAKIAFSHILKRIEKVPALEFYTLRSGRKAIMPFIEMLAPGMTDSSTFDSLFALPEEVAYRSPLESLTKALATVAGKLAPEHADWAFAQIRAQMEKTTEPYALKYLAEALATVSGDRNPQQLIDLMKWPTCVGEVRAPLLAKLEQQTGQKFEGNVWNMVKWAQANGYDVKSPPQRPGRSE